MAEEDEFKEDDAHGENILDCGGKRSATPLLEGGK